MQFNEVESGYDRHGRIVKLLSSTNAGFTSWHIEVEYQDGHRQIDRSYNWENDARADYNNRTTVQG